MKQLLTSIILVLSFSAFSQISQKEMYNLETKLFNDLATVKCRGIGAIHSYLNESKIFIMDKKYDNGLLFYKINPKFQNSLSVGVYEKNVGYRIVFEDSYIYNQISEKGQFVETHKEGDIFFLVYKFNNEDYLLHSYVHKGNTFYSIDSYCIE